MSKAGTTRKNLNLFEVIYKVVKLIPEGKVATYGQIAEQVNSLSKSSRVKVTPRVVGFAMHANKDSRVACHRVVDRNGRLAPNFAFNGWKEQKYRLKVEGIEFIDKMHVNLEKHLWEPR